jgi:hypothetical protein
MPYQPIRPIYLRGLHPIQCVFAAAALLLLILYFPTVVAAATATLYIYTILFLLHLQK